MAAINPTITLAVSPSVGFFHSTTFSIHGKLNGMISGVLTPATGSVVVQCLVSNSVWTNLGSSITLDGSGSFSYTGSLLSATTSIRVVFTSSNTAVWNSYIGGGTSVFLTASTKPYLYVNAPSIVQQSGGTNTTFRVTVCVNPDQNYQNIFGVATNGEIMLLINGVPVNSQAAYGSSGVGFPLFVQNGGDGNIVYSFDVPTSALSVGANQIVGYYSGGFRTNITWLASTSDPITVTLVNPSQHSFTLPYACTNTTVVVNGSNGNQVRTIWSGKSMPSGVGYVDWDGLDDFGNTPPTDTYTVNILYGNPTYNWLGVFGNTSYDSATMTPNFVGFNVWDQNGSWPSDMCCFGTRAYFAGNYAERRPTAFTSLLSNLNSPQVMTPYIDQARQVDYCATDGTNVYMVNTGGGWPGQIACVVAYSATAPYAQFPFIDGTTSPVGVPPYTEVIDVGTASGTNQVTLTNVGTGIAVQTSGTVLAVAHGNFYTSAQSITVTPGANLIKLFNKTTGALLNTITVTNPRRMACDTSGNLWVIHSGSNLSGATVTQYTSLDTTPVAGISLSGLVFPIAISCDPSTGDVVVVDGGTNQQIKRFNHTTGALISTIGVLGGMADGDANITDTRFYFDTTPGVGGHVIGGFFLKTWVCVAPDSSVWVSDSGNMRMMHFSSTGTYIERVTFFPSNSNYQMVVDKADPTSVFAEWLEYTIDYTKTLAPGDPGTTGFWKLSRNWSVCLPSSYSYPASVCTLSNSTTYALMNYNVGSTSYGYPSLAQNNPTSTMEIVSLDKTAGSVIRSGTQNYNGVWAFNNNNAIAGYAGLNTTISGVPYQEWTYETQAVTGFSTGFPNFGSATTVASVTVPYNIVSFTAVLTGSVITSLTHTVAIISGLPNGHYPFIFSSATGSGAAGYMTITGATAATSGMGFVDGTVGYVLTSGGTGYTASPATLITMNIGVTSYPTNTGGWSGQSSLDVTTGGYYAFCQSAASYVMPSYHLGGVKAGAIATTPPLATFSWLGSPAGDIVLADGIGTFSNQHSFGGHNGQMPLVAGAYIIGTYDGQYAPYSNQWVHYTEDGIFIGQFGVGPNPLFQTGTNPIQFGLAGNISRFIAVVVGSDIYCFCTDESVHAGIHVWKISSLSTIGRIVCS